MGYEKTLKAFEKSCKQLQLDYIDLFLIHFPGAPHGGRKPQPSVEHARNLRIDTWKAMEKLYEEGKCRAIGVSNFEKRHLDGLINENDIKVFPMVNQCEFHPYFSNKEVFELCKELKIQFEV
jgi:diketogulonate reductase-like aldo/keto reductase